MVYLAGSYTNKNVKVEENGYEKYERSSEGIVERSEAREGERRDIREGREERNPPNQPF
jgi:hypothetical protein